MKPTKSYVESHLYSRASFTMVSKFQLHQTSFLHSWEFVELATKPHLETEHRTKHHSQILKRRVHYFKFQYKNLCALCTEKTHEQTLRIKLWLYTAHKEMVNYTHTQEECKSKVNLC